MAYSRAEVLIMRMSRLLKKLRTTGWPGHIDVRKDIANLEAEMEELGDRLERDDWKRRT
jgi:hypothetical protein